MSRVGNLSLDCDNEHDYYLLEKNSKIKKNVLEKYEIMNLKLIKYKILRKKY